MDQSEANRFALNKNNKQGLSIQVNNDQKQNKASNQTHDVKKLSKTKLNLQDDEPVMYKKPENTQENYNKNFNAKYGKAIIPNNNNEEMIYADNLNINNQISPNKFKTTKFGFVPTTIICPHCHNNTLTVIQESFNCGTCFVFILAIVLIPILIILAAITGCKSTHYNHMCNCDCCCCGTGTCDCRCCFDSYHYCQHCGKEIGRRNSCIEICPCFDCC